MKFSQFQALGFFVMGFDSATDVLGEKSNDLILLDKVGHTFLAVTTLGGVWYVKGNPSFIIDTVAYGLGYVLGHYMVEANILAPSY